MRKYFIGVLLMATASVAAAGQQPATAEKTNKNVSRTVTLSGCVAKGNGQPNQVTLDDIQNGKYQLSGNRIGRYLGQRVEIAGTPDTSRLKIKAGLWPTPNVAGQGSSMDPARAAVASQPGGPSFGTGDADLPSFRVKSIKMLDGGCQ